MLSKTEYAVANLKSKINSGKKRETVNFIIAKNKLPIIKHGVRKEWEKYQR